MKKELIAPCGMNCGLCVNFLRAENKCPGCTSGRKVNGRAIKCGIKLCSKRQGDYCFDCADFPCARLQKLDERYQARYGMSEIKNLKAIKGKGMEAFLKEESQKWVNAEGVLCVHDQKRYQN